MILKNGHIWCFELFFYLCKTRSVVFFVIHQNIYIQCQFVSFICICSVKILLLITHRFNDFEQFVFPPTTRCKPTTVQGYNKSIYRVLIVDCCIKCIYDIIYWYTNLIIANGKKSDWTYTTWKILECISLLIKNLFWPLLLTISEKNDSNYIQKLYLVSNDGTTVG